MESAGGRKPSFPAREEKLADWVYVSRQRGFIVTHTNIRIRALNMIKDPNLQSFKTANFVVSGVFCCGW